MTFYDYLALQRDKELSCLIAVARALYDQRYGESEAADAAGRDQLDLFLPEEHR